MTVLRKQRVVLDRVAQATDLLSQVVRVVEHQVDGLGDFTVLLLVVGELDRARVDVAVDPLPGAHLLLERLELDARQAEILRTHDQVSALKALLGVRSDEAEDGHSTDAPLTCMLGDLAHGDGQSCQSLFDEHSGSEA